MFTFYNQRPGNVNVGAGAGVKANPNPNTVPMLGTTATVNPNLGGVQNAPSPFNQYQNQAGNAMAATTQGALNQYPPHQYPPQQYPPQQYPPQQNPPQGGNMNNQLAPPVTPPQNTGLVQSIPGPGYPNPNLQPPTNNTLKPVPPGPGYPQDNKNSFSTAQTSRTPSTAGPVTTQNRQNLPPGQKQNGVKQSGPPLAFMTNFKDSCNKTPIQNSFTKVIIPWDHDKQNYVYDDKSFDILKNKANREGVKSVSLPDLESRPLVEGYELEPCGWLRSMSK